jgi:hypothetical protein
VTLAIIVYAAPSLVIGGAVVTYEIWHCPTLLDRADGNGKFTSPKMGLGEVIFFSLFAALFWPLLAIAAITDTWGARK